MMYDEEASEQKPAIIENVHGWKHHKKKSAFEEVKLFLIVIE
jgi:hypothetical protein